MIKLISQSGTTQYGVNEYLLDSVDDIEKLSACAPGSVALVVPNEGSIEFYMKNNQGLWIKI